jgi:microcystin-dependent protein
MGQTLNFELPYPMDPDPADVPSDMKALCDRLEVVLGQLKSGGAIPGEVRAWSGAAVPDQATYGRWVWADGAIYPTAQFPVAAGHIHPNWRTFYGQSDPGAGNFRVPDLRGLVPAGVDAMPGGQRANRVTRGYAGTVGAAGGEELHTRALAESPAPHHGVSDPGHMHTLAPNGTAFPVVLPGTGAPGGYGNGFVPGSYNRTDNGGAGISVGQAGGGGAHENLQPTAFVPYIVKLDD